MIRERDPDVEYDEMVQRQIDDARELSDACEAWFDNSTFIELAALRDVYLEGQAAGFKGASAGWNPHADVHSPEYQIWEIGRVAGEGARFLQANARFA